MSYTKKIGCRQARKQFPALEERAKLQQQLADGERGAIEEHLNECRNCAREYQILTLTRATLDAAATSEQVVADDTFFRLLRARINRGPEQLSSRPAEESWAAALLATARQLIPAMAMLLLLIIGATFVWSADIGPANDQVALRPRDRVIFSDMYEYPEPTRDDVLETLVAAEEKENGK